MCVIIVKPGGLELSEETCKSAFEQNSDGAGFMFSDNNRLFVQKGYFKFSSLWHAYEKLNLTDKNVVLHFRMATSGKKDQKNCHPFYVNGDIAFAHNGVMRGFSYSADVSDTYLFNQLILRKLPADFIKYEGVQILLKGLCENNYERLVFMDNLGQYYIFGEKYGDWKNGLWFSSAIYVWKPATNPIIVHNSSEWDEGIVVSSIYDDWINGADNSRINLKEDEISVVSNDDHKCSFCGINTVCYSPYKSMYICMECINVLLNDSTLCGKCGNTVLLNDAGPNIYECPYCHGEITLDEIIWNGYDAIMDRRF